MAAVRASGPGEISGADDEAPPSAIYAMFEHDAVDLVRMDAATIGNVAVPSAPGLGLPTPVWVWGWWLRTVAPEW